METTLTKRTLTGAIVKAQTISQSSYNSYKLKITVEKASHNLLIGGTVDIKISGLAIVNASIMIDNNISDNITDIFNQQRKFNVISDSILTCDLDINSSLYPDLTIISGTPLIQVNNSKINLLPGQYNFELINKTNYPNLRVWDLNYRLAIREIGIGKNAIYNGAPDYYSDETIATLKDINEQDLTFNYCQIVEISIVDASGNPISDSDYTKTTNIGLIINKQ